MPRTKQSIKSTSRPLSLHVQREAPRMWLDPQTHRATERELHPHPEPEGLPAPLIWQISTRKVSLGSRSEIRKCRCCAARRGSTCFFEPSTRRAQLGSPPSGVGRCHQLAITSRPSKGDTVSIPSPTRSRCGDIHRAHEGNGAPYRRTRRPRDPRHQPGDGRHALRPRAARHVTPPLQAGFSILRVAIVGDILHSRVRARNPCVTTSDPEIRVIGPKTLLPTKWRPACKSIRTCSALKDVDVVMMLRLQNERCPKSDLLASAQEFSSITADRAKLELRARCDRPAHGARTGREIDSSVADGEHRQS